MKTMKFLFKLSVSLLVLITIEGLATLGLAFEFSKYNVVATIAQVCFLIICTYVSMLDWDEKEKPDNQL